VSWRWRVGEFKVRSAGERVCASGVEFGYGESAGGGGEALRGRALEIVIRELYLDIFYQIFESKRI
jgi:hypothetical protein